MRNKPSNKQIKITIRENKTLNENKKNILKEIKIEDVIASIGSKSDLKRIYSQETQYLKTYSDGKFDEHKLEKNLPIRVQQLKNWIKWRTPRDLDPNQKGVSAIWLKNQVLTDFNVYTDIIGESDSLNLGHSLEEFFKFQRFIEQPYKDLMKNEDAEMLWAAITKARPFYMKWIEQKDYADAAKGTEVIYEDNEFKIFIPNNKGAACELGKGTHWCTAAPGLNYYEDYHKPNDPLFIIFKTVKNPDNTEIINQQKFQFHYGSSQFMTADDTPIFDLNGGTKLFMKIHNILIQSVGDRFPFLKDAIVETDIGISMMSIKRQSDCEECPSYDCIRYKDILKDIAYGGERPAQIKIYDEDNQLSFSFEWTLVNNNSSGKPLKFDVYYHHGKYVLGDGVWYLKSPQQTLQIAQYRSDKKSVELSTGNIFRYLYDRGEVSLKGGAEVMQQEISQVWAKNGKDFYEREIQPNPDAFAQKLIDYLPESVKESVKEKIGRRDSYYDSKDLDENRIKPMIKIKIHQPIKENKDEFTVQDNPFHNKLIAAFQKRFKGVWIWIRQNHFPGERLNESFQFQGGTDKFEKNKENLKEDIQTFFLDFNMQMQETTIGWDDQYEGLIGRGPEGQLYRVMFYPNVGGYYNEDTDNKTMLYVDMMVEQ